MEERRKTRPVAMGQTEKGAADTEVEGRVWGVGSLVALYAVASVIAAIVAAVLLVSVMVHAFFS